MKEVNFTGEEVVGLTATYLPAEDVAFVEKAFDFATEAHKPQFRKSGEPYIVHPYSSSRDFGRAQIRCYYSCLWIFA